MSASNKIPDLIIQLSDGLSNHIKTSARYWMALALISVITVISSFPESGNPIITESNSVSIPFGIGDIDKNYFYPFAVALISLLTISFGAAQAQMIRARKLTNTAIRAIYRDLNLAGGIDLRDALDVINATSINRTAPLAQLILGKYQFYPTKDNQPKIRKFIAVCYQSALKVSSYLVVYLLPLYALYIALVNGGLFNCHGNIIGLPLYFLWVVSGLATFIILQLLYLELHYAVCAIKRIYGI